MHISSYLTILLLIGMVGGAWWWLNELEDHTVIHILASQEPDLGLPIFAQFTAVQIVTLDRPVVLGRLVVPVYFPVADTTLTVDLVSEEELLWRWRVRPLSLGTVPVDLPLPEIPVRAGQLAVEFSAAHVGHDRAAEAARLFVEPDDSKYAQGNYRIAGNQKQGDISLKVVERRSVKVRVWESFQQRPLVMVAAAGRVGLLGLLLLALPGVMASVIWPRRTQ